MLDQRVALISYEDVVIQEPHWWPVWIGPQQQQQPGDSLGQKCSLLYPLDKRCSTPSCVDFRNITLRGIDVQVKGRLTWPWTGAILGSSDNPMQDVDFRRVIADPLVRDRWLLPNQRQSYYACTGADGSHKFSAPTPKCLTGGAHQQRRRPTEDEKDL